MKELRLTNDKWDLLKLKIFCKQRALSIGQNSSLWNGKRFSPMVHTTESLFPKYMKKSGNKISINQIIKLKIGYRYIQKLLYCRISNDCKTLNEMFDFFIYQVNENQKFSIFHLIHVRRVKN